MKKLILSLAAALLLFALPGWAEEGITSPEQLNAPGIVIGVSQGSAAELIVASELPQAGMAYFTDNNTAYLAVAQGKIDAFVFDFNQMRLAIEQGVTGVHLLKETLGEPVQVAVGLSPKSKIDDLEGKINRFIAELRADGTLEDMFSRWVLTGERSMPDIAAPQNPTLHLTVGTSGVVFPYSYYEGDQLSGYDIELARRFAAWLGADVEFKVYDYGAIIPAALTGDVDCIMANLNITAERREMLTFSDLLYEEKLGVMVRGEEHVPAWAAYNGKRIGVLVGGITETVANTYLPNSEHVYLTSYPDCVAALLAGKIDAYLVDEPEVKSVHAEQPRIDYIRERFTNQEYSFAFRKNDPKSAALCEELNAFLAQCRQDGTIQELEDIWFGADEARKVVDMSGLTGENGTIRVITTSTDMPFSYIKDGKNVGYDIDLVVRFCRSAGYRLELGDADFAARIPAVQSGKYDFSTDMNVTPERQEEVLFSDPTSSGGIVLAILADGAEQDQTVSEAAPSLAISQLTGRRIGVQTGTISGEVASALIPGITLSYFNTQTDILSALRADKIYAWCTDEPILRYVSIENPDLQLLPDTLDTSSLAAVFPMTEEGQALRDQYSAFVDQLWADGTMAEIDSAWFSGDESRYTVLDYASLPDTNGTLRMALDSSILPFAFVKNGRVVGYDVDIAARFCQANGYRLQVMPMDFNGVLSSLQSGKADFAACGITVTAERSESMLFSSPTYHSGTSVAILSKSASQADGYTALSQLSDARIGVQTGSSFAEAVTQRLPEAQVDYYIGKADLMAALTGHKVEAFVVDEPVAQIVLREDSRLTYLPEYLENYEFALVFPKTAAGEALRDQFNAFLKKFEADGRLDALALKWFGEDEAQKTMPDISALSAENGTLRLATESGYAPFEYVRDGQVVGYDMELAILFCQEYGYGLEIVDMNFDGILPAIQTGKCDFAAAGIGITPERAESVLFSAPNFTSGTVAVVLKDTSVPDARPSAGNGERADAPTFWDDLSDSFNKTFLRENRWKLFLEGIGTTTLITLLSILFGTALGFGIFMLCRNGNPIANGTTRFSMWLVQGTPMVVLLMILYYIIFGSVAISGVAVAVIGFTLTFGAAVFGLIRMGVGTIDRGQYEAAYALGHSNRHTFFKIILPQAIPHVLPAYQGEIVGLIKATAIVGYIAVQDLTKMGDIVRSRTYEAFFPLIAVTVIYFVLEGLFSFAVGRIRISLDPKKRKRDHILRGVNTHD